MVPRFEAQVEEERRRVTPAQGGGRAAYGVWFSQEGGFTADGPA